MDEIYEGDIVSPGTEVVDVRTGARQQLIDNCVQLNGTHDWRLHLNPDTPDVVEVYCGNCPAQLDDVWSGALRYLHLQLPGFSVVDGQHTATELVDQPLDIFIRESQQFDVGTMSFSSEFEVQAQLKGAALPTGEGTGTGWCAPSP
jgi:hypothetical protein